MFLSNISWAQPPQQQPLSDDQLLELVQRQTFRYFYQFAHPDCGMARERSAPARRSETAPTDLLDTVTTGGTGFGLMAVPIAVERQWIERPQAREHVTRIVEFLERVPRFHGAWAHWYNGRTGAVKPFSRRDDGGDLVETAFLVQGLLSVREFFDGQDEAERSLRQRITRLWHEVDWRWYQNEHDYLLWHWSPQHQFAMNLPIRGFNECMLVYVLAVASPSHPVDASVYHSGWAQSSASATDGKYIRQLRRASEASPTRRPPLFLTHYSHLGLSPYLRDTYVTAAGFRDYADHHRQLALQSHRWCRQQVYPADCWGLTSSDDPDVGYREHAASAKQDNGTVAPTAALASIVYTPQESLAFLRYLWANQQANMWTETGWRDAFRLRDGWFAPAQLAIDQGPIIVMIENHRTGSPWRRFMAIPEIQRALEAIGLQPTSPPEK